MEQMLKDKVAVVTGAGRGIGREVALLMAAYGAKVVVNDAGVSLDGTDANDRPALEVAREIEAAGGQAIADTGSVSRRGAGPRDGRQCRRNFREDRHCRQQRRDPART